MGNDIRKKAINRAMEARDFYGLKLLDRVDIINILTKENISVIFKNYPGKISGFFLRKGNIGLVYINSSKSLGHQLFTAAHELYHYKYDKENNSKVCLINNFDKDYENEVEANYFASYFLMPDDALRYYINLRTINGERDLNIRDIIFLEQHFMVSRAFMLIRLVANDFITPEQADQYKQGVIHEAIKLGYDDKLYKPAEKELVIISNYAELATELLENEKISYGKYEELLITGNYGDILFGTDEKGTINEDHLLSDYF